MKPKPSAFVLLLWTQYALNGFERPRNVDGGYPTEEEAHGHAEGILQRWNSSLGPGASRYVAYSVMPLYRVV